jgi:hypothetical protein
MSVPYTPQHRFDLIPSPVDHRDFRLSAPIDAASLPPSATLPLDPTIRDQGNEGSCWGFSGSSAHGDGRFMAKKSTELEVLSPAFLYWQTRRSMGDTADDTGSDLRTGLDTLLHVGNCLESAMPYRAGDWAVEPPADAVIDASTRTIVAYHRLTTLAEIKYTIAVLKLTVVLGIPVTQAFEEARNGVVPMILPSDRILGGHAIRVWGYHDDPGVTGGTVLDLPNSWGSGAGDHGHYYLPSGYIFNSFIDWAEAWAIEP